MCAAMYYVQEGCKATLERAYSASKPEKRHMELLGHGNGFTFEASPYCSCAGRDGVHVLFAGEVGEWPGINAVNAAHDGKLQCRAKPAAALYRNAHSLWSVLGSPGCLGSVDCRVTTSNCM